MLELEARLVLHELTLELVHAVAEQLCVEVEHHTIVHFKSSVHECFEYLLESMEARDLTLHDILQADAFLDDASRTESQLSRLNIPMSPFKYNVCTLTCPPFMQDNHVEVLVMASKVSSLIKARLEVSS